MHVLDVTAGGKSNGRVVKLARRPPTVTVEGTFFQSLSKWTLSKVTAALDEHKQGCFYQSALLADALLDDPQIFAHARTRVGAFSSRSGLPFSIDASNGVDDRRAESVRRRVEQLWWDMVPDAELASLHMDAVFLGVAVGRTVWKREHGEWIPRLERLRPSGLRWDDTIHAFRYLDGCGVDHIVTPGVNGWVLHAPFGGDSWTKGALRALGIPFFARTFAVIRDWLRFNERHALPALIVEDRFPQSDDIEGQEGEAGASEFFEQFRNLGKNPVIRLPQGQTSDEPKANARWLELVSTSYEGFERLYNKLQAEIVSVLLGRDPESSAAKLGGDGASVVEKVRNEHLIADADALQNTLRDQVLKPFVGFNVSPNLLGLAPWPKWQARPQADLASRVSTLNTAADALAKLESLGIDIVPVIEELHLQRINKPKPKPVQPPPEPNAPMEEPDEDEDEEEAA